MELVTEYPAPLETISKVEDEVIAAPLPSIIPVTHKSSLAVAELDPLSVLTFLPIGKSVFEAPLHFTAVSYTHLTLPTNSGV